MYSETNNFCAEVFHSQGSERKILADAAQEKQEGSKVSGKEVLEQVKRSEDTDCGPQTMRRAHSAVSLGKFFWRNAGRKERPVQGLLEEFGKLMRRCQWMISAA